MSLAYRTAVACWLGPLTIGVSIFAAWLVTRWDGWVMAGIFVTYFIGPPAVVVGLVAAVVWCRRALRTPGVSARRACVTTTILSAVLLSNFVVAGGISVAVMVIESRYTVVVQNASGGMLDEVRVTGGGCDVDFGRLTRGETATRSFWVKQDGELTFRASGPTATYEKKIESYVTNGQGGHATVTVQPTGEVTVFGVE